MTRFLWTAELLDVIRAGMAKGMSVRAVADGMGMTKAAVQTASKRHKLGDWPGAEPVNKLDAPADLVERVAELPSRRQIQYHYGVSHNTVTRWMREAKLTANAPPPRPKKPKVSRVTTSDMGRMKAPNIIAEPIRDDSLPGRAARHLQKWGPCYRDGAMWRRGNTLLNDNEIVERAIAKGMVL